MIKLSIVIPVYNELDLLKKKLTFLFDLKKYYSDKVEIIIFDSNSSDGSNEVLNYIRKQELARIKYFNSDFSSESRSIGRALAQATQYSLGEITLVLPVDVDLSLNAIVYLISTDSNKILWGCFYKKYSGAGILMSIYSNIQNIIHTLVLKQAVWTNVIFFRTELRVKIPVCGFLEDVIFSDNLNQIAKPSICKIPVLVSARKYLNDGEWRRIIDNGIIIFLFRLGYSNFDKLKKYYNKKIKFNKLWTD